MPLYEYLCPVCKRRFEALRPMARADDPIACPEGHAGGRRALSVFATVGGACSPSPNPRFT